MAVNRLNVRVVSFEWNEVKPVFSESKIHQKAEHFA
jgi:hypothetical protein